MRARRLARRLVGSEGPFELCAGLSEDRFLARTLERGGWVRLRAFDDPFAWVLGKHCVRAARIWSPLSFEHRARTIRSSMPSTSAGQTHFALRPLQSGTLSGSALKCARAKICPRSTMLFPSQSSDHSITLRAPGL